MNSPLSIAEHLGVDRGICLLPLAYSTVRAGFPSPAADFGETRIDLMSELVTHPQATFLLRVRGLSMIDAGLGDGDTIIVDRAIKPANGHIVVAVVDGEFTVKHLQLRAGHMKLKAANPTYPDITPKDGQTVEVWGVVTACIKQFR
ncbi:translesion error-prone DNA polymerase V autoproteolytic subunit [Acidovorax sp. BLS4]|uniref:LexA family protein n=1 Tax=Acidovorax sp. BLS4 TaxID=3273430 RepID=UPI0029432F57|nr:translesion error-prone DNA polymerase V autoproteolytic subunit [Paracidovorax avenae]WOI43805.1 translesion error-prone DNA polymerase V autoproteolytic subunit [Paracidovorax avenae]